MDTSLLDLYNDYNRIIGSIRYDERNLDYSIARQHIRDLTSATGLSNTAVSVFDLYRRDHLYLSKRFETLFGHDLLEAQAAGITYFDRFIHPEDIKHMLAAGTRFLRMVMNMSPDEVKHFKLISDYRRKNRDGVYIRVLEQQMALETDGNGNLWLALSLLDVLPSSDISAPFMCRLINTKTGETTVYLPFDVQLSLTPREKEVLQLVSAGLISKQIADRLFISVNTVNTHRQRILEKLKVSNSAQAVQCKCLL